MNQTSLAVTVGAGGNGVAVGGVVGAGVAGAGIGVGGTGVAVGNTGVAVAGIVVAGRAAGSLLVQLVAAMANTSRPAASR